MTEFETLELVTDLEVKGQEVEPNSETLDPAPSHTPTPPPEGQSQTGTSKASTNQSKPGLSQAKGMMAHDCHCYNEDFHCLVFKLYATFWSQFQPFFLLRLLAPGPVLLSLEEGPSMEGPSVEVGPSVEIGSSANLGSNGELSRCRACGGRAPGDAFLQGKFCCLACAQPSSGR